MSLIAAPQSALARYPSIQKHQRKEPKRLSLLNEPKTSRFRHSVGNMRFTSPVSKDMFSRGGKVKGLESPLSRKADNVELIRSISQAGWQSKPSKPPQLPMVSVMEAIVLEDSPSTEPPAKIPPLSVEAVRGLGIQMGNSVEVLANGACEKDGDIAAREKEGTVIVTQTVHVQSESTDTTPAIEIPDRKASRKLRPRISVTIPENRALSFRRVRRGGSQHYEKENDTSEPVSPGSNPGSQSMGHSPNFKLEVVSPVSVEMPKPHRPSRPSSLGVPGTSLVTDPDEKEPSSASSMGRIDDDASSCYSPRSSMSSFHADQLPERKPSPARSEVVEFMIISPTDAGVFDDVSPFPKTPKSKAHALRRSKLTLSTLKNKPLPPEPFTEVAPLLVTGKPCSRTASINASHIRSHSDPYNSVSPVSPIPFSTHLSMSPVDLDTLDEAFRRSSPLFFEPRKLKTHEPSPTLDEATDALEIQLSALAETPFVSFDVSPHDPLQISRGLMDMVPTRPPPPPPVSSDSMMARPRPKRKAVNHVVSQIKPDDVITAKPSSAPTMTIGKRISLSIAARKAKASALEAVPESVPEPPPMDRKGSSISSSASSSAQSEESIFTKSSTQDTANSERSSSIELQDAPAEEVESKLRRNPSKVPRPRSTDLLAASSMPIILTPQSSPEPQCSIDPEQVNDVITADAAEKVILNIMIHLDTLADLFTCAHLNRGFYRTFKRNELPLIKETLFKMSPAAWELREICPPYEQGGEDCDAPLPEYTPSIYLRHYSRDMYAMVALKSLILHHCSSFLRAETVSALSGTDEVRSSRIDDAFWRVWTFCRIFGCGKNREEDIVGQMDWLKGGVLAYQQSTESSMIFTDDFGLNSVLFNPPTGFAKGNGKGLSTDELYDMTEIWTCLGVLLRGFHGMRSEAREAGIFDNTGIKKDDVNAEDPMLEEWTYHLLTLSPSVILTLCSSLPFPSTTPTASTFALAKSLGLTRWPAPAPGCSRRLFLKEAVTRVYESKFTTSPTSFVRSPTTVSPRSPLQKSSPSFHQQRIQQRRRHSSLLAAELRRSRHTHSHSEPNPNANPDTHLSIVSALHPLSNAQEGARPPLPTRAPPPPPPYSPSSIVIPSPTSLRSPSRYSPPRHATQVTDPVDVALKTLTHEMGFSEADAKRALAETDSGEAINLNAAAELLVREREQRNLGIADGRRRRSSTLTRTSGVSERWCRVQAMSSPRKVTCERWG